MSVLHIDGHHDLVVELLDGLGEEPGIEGGGRPQDGPGRAGLQSPLDRVDRAQAPAELDRHGDVPADGQDHLGVRPGPQRRVQVDDVQPASAVGLEALGNLDGVGVVHRLGRRIAPEQPHASPSVEVDRGDDDHVAASFTKAS